MSSNQIKHTYENKQTIHSISALFTGIPFVIKVISIFIFFLLTIPEITKTLIPCLKHLPGQAYEFSQCNLDRVFNMYLLIAILGLSLSIFTVFYYHRPPLKKLMMISSIFAALTIISFHLYIPRAEADIVAAPIYLDSVTSTLTTK